MRIFLYTILFFIINPYYGSCQYHLKGFLGVEGGESFSYILEFTDSSGHISGYSYTYRTEKKDVKARIEGFLDKQNQTLSFSEQELIYNHGFESNATICLIQAVLRFVKEDNTIVFKGAITTSDITNVSCSGGTVIMNDMAAVRDVFEKSGTRPDRENRASPPDKPVSKPVKYVYDTASGQKALLSVRDPITKVTEGMPTVLYWQSDTVILYVWDGGKVDGDVISISAGENNLLDKYTLTKNKKKLLIPLTTPRLIITIMAENEGNEPPNTANLILEDNSRQHYLLTYNTIGKIAKIQIIKK